MITDCCHRYKEQPLKKTKNRRTDDAGLTGSAPGVTAGVGLPAPVGLADEYHSPGDTGGGDLVVVGLHLVFIRGRISKLSV